MMKDWYLNLSLREKQMVVIGGIVTLIALLYALLWAPLNNKINTLRETIRHDQNVLTFMQEADLRIQQLAKNQTAPADITGSTLSTIQDQMKKSPFAEHVTELRQSDADSVQITLQKVDFDKLIHWLTQLWQTTHIAVAQCLLTPTEAPGIVNVELSLNALK